MPRARSIDSIDGSVSNITSDHETLRALTMILTLSKQIARCDRQRTEYHRIRSGPVRVGAIILDYSRPPPNIEIEPDTVPLGALVPMSSFIDIVAAEPELCLRLTALATDVCRRFMSESADVEDAVGASWLKAIESESAALDPDRIGAWFKVIVERGLHRPPAIHEKGTY